MEEIVFSIFNHGAVATEALKTVLLQFENKFGIQVRLEIIPNWVQGWSRLVENALYRSGPDISEAGNTWIGDLARMDALHPFDRSEVAEITKNTRIINNVLKSRANSGDENALFYSIPWTGDTRAIFYRRDALKKAGIDENSGFSNIDEFKNTISTLKENGFPAPLVLTTRRSSLTVHYVATWIWNTGGEFLSVDGSRITFDDEPAMEGCKAFFHLGEYIDDQEKMRDEDQTNHSFRTGKSVVNLSGPWMLNLDLFSPDVRENLGVMPIPGTPFVGGQDFVIWKHSRHIPAARKLIGYLHSDEAGKLIYPLYGLPVSETMWETAPFNTGFYSIFLSAIQKGRSLHGQLWGLVEKRLTDEYAEIWAEILKTQPTQWDTIIETRMKNLAHRLQLSMGD